MSKRPTQPGQPAQAPPLPPGPPPPSDPNAQAAAIQAAWQQYYAQGGQPAPTSATASGSGSYANYGYGAGAAMPGVSPSPASAGLVNPAYASIAPGAGGVAPGAAAYGYPGAGAAYGQQAYMGMGQQQMGYGQPPYGQQVVPGMNGMGMGMAPGMGMNMGMGMGMYGQGQQPGMGMQQQQPYGAQQQYGMQHQQQPGSLIQPAGPQMNTGGQFNASQQGQQAQQHGPVQPHGLPSRPAGGAPGVVGAGQPGSSAPRNNGPPQGPGNFPPRNGPSGPQINQPYYPPGPGGINNRGAQQQPVPPHPQVPGSRGPFDPRNNPIRNGDDFGPGGGGGPTKRQRTDGPPPNLGIVPRDSVAARPQVPGSRGPFDPRNNTARVFPDEERRAALEIRERDSRDVRGGSEFGGSHDGYRDGGREDYRSPRGGGRGRAGGVGSGAYPRRESRDGAGGGRYEDRRPIGGGDYDRGGGVRGGRGGSAIRGAARGGRGGGSGAFPVRAGLSGSSTAPPTGPKGNRDAKALPKGNGIAAGKAGSISGGVSSANGKSGSGGKPPSGPAKDLESDKVREEKARDTLRHRTLTDFKIVGLEIKALNWSWGQIREDTTDDADDDDDNASGNEEDEIENGFGSAVEDDDEDDGEEEVERKPLPARPLKRERSFEEEANGRNGEAKADSTEPPTKIHKTEPDADASVEEEAANKTAPPSRRSSEVEDTTAVEATDAPATPLLKSEPKTGEKRKAKMSSPDADDDALLISKKRLATESAVSRDVQTPSKPSSPASVVQNRFRIYFDSVVAPPEPPIEAASAEESAMDEVVEEEQAADAEGPAIKQEEATEDAGDGDVSMQGSIAPEEDAAEGKTDDDAAVAAPTVESESADVEVKVEQEVASQTAQEQVEIGTSVDAVPVLENDSSEEPVAPKVEEEVVVPEETVVSEDAPSDVSMTEVVGDAPEVQDQPAVVASEVATMEMVEPITAPEPNEEPTSDNLGDFVLLEASAADSTANVVASDSTEVPAEEKSASKSEEVSAEAVATAAVEEAARLAAALKASAENTVAAYTQRAQRAKDAPAPSSDPNAAEFRRSPSLPPTSASTPLPSASRISILYDNGSRRICVNSSLVERLQIHRKKGIIQAQLRLSIAGAQQRRNEAVEDISQKTEEIDVQAPAADEEAKEDVKEEGMESEASASADEKSASTAAPLPTPVWELTDGLMLELHDSSTGTFTQLSSEALKSIWAVDPDSAAAPDEAFPPLHMLVAGMIPGESVRLTAYLDQERALTEAKWVKTGQVEEWIRSGSKVGFKRPEVNASNTDSWTGKIDIVDPEAPVNLVNVLDLWAEASKLGIIKERRRFVQTHLMHGTNPLQILLRLVRGSEPVLTRNTIPHLFTPLDKAIDLHAEYADKQSISSLAVMAIANIAREFAVKAGEASGVADKKMADVVKALPNKVLFPICDELFVEWAKSNQKVASGKKGGKR